MAIKGKKKSRGGGRAVAAPPRPVLVAQRRPLLKRTGFRITLALVLLTLIILGAALGIGARNRGRQEQAAQEAVRTFQTRVEAALTAKAVGQDLGSGFVILPEFGQRLSAVQAGEADAGEIADLAGRWSTDVTEAATKIAGLNPGTSTAADDLLDIREQLRQGLTLFSGMAKELAVAVGLKGEPREALVAVLQEQFASSAAVFDAAWRELQELRARIGIPEQAPAGAPGGIPGAPGGIPGVPGAPGGIPGIPGEPGSEVPGS
jgi:type II secretory pathway pseudopilin PulG